MKIVFAVAILTVAVAATTEVSPVFNYHMRSGIPLAAKIKNLEEQNANQRIVGGSVSDISQTPYQLGLVIQIFIFTSVCGASLISPTLAVTAAHCYFDGLFTASSFTVVAGSNTLFSGGQRLVTTDVTTHPQWEPQSVVANDIAVVRVSGFSLSNLVQTIALPSGNELSENFFGWNAIASGYGMITDYTEITTSQVLSSVTLPIISLEECRAVYGDWVPDANLCTSGADGKGTCSGDSGGPLAVDSQGRRILIGVTSFGSSAGCEADFPASFARVTSYVDWISLFN